MKPSSSTSEGDEYVGGALLGPLFESPAVSVFLSDEQLLWALLVAERHLVQAASEAGIVPAEAAAAIAEATAHPDRLPDATTLGREALATGNPVPALVTALTAAVPESARPFVHLGATSQDIVDTALASCVKAAGQATVRLAEAAVADLADLARRHRDTLMVARTLGQHAAPTTAGLVMAGWMWALDRAAGELSDAVAALPAQLGGAVGTRAAFGDRGAAVVRAFAALCDLAPPGPLPWQTDRAPWIRVGHGCAQLAAATGKIASDVVMLTATDVGELVIVGEARGGSSALPHKRNPVDAVLITGDVIRIRGLVGTLFAAAVHDGQRATGAWHAEWQTLRELMAATGGATGRTRELVAALDVDAGRMRANLDRTGGAVMAESLAARLAAGLGRTEAQAVASRVVAAAAADGRPVAEAAAADDVVRAALSPDEIDAALDPENWLGDAARMVDAAIAEIGGRDRAGSP